MCLPCVKRYFQQLQWNTFFFMAQITHIMLFLGMPLLERWKIIVYENETSSKKFLQWSFRYLSTLCKKVFSAASVKLFSLGLKYLRLSCFGECWFWRDQRSQFKHSRFFKSCFTVNFFYRDLTFVKKYLVGVNRAPISWYLVFFQISWISWISFSKYQAGNNVPVVNMNVYNIYLTKQYRKKVAR